MKKKLFLSMILLAGLLTCKITAQEAKKNQKNPGSKGVHLYSATQYTCSSELSTRRLFPRIDSGVLKLNCFKRWFSSCAQDH